jgi:Family of unknown function (DUF5681)
MPFVKGQSGNPAGRPVGSHNKFTRDMQEALDKKGLPVIDVIVEHAFGANPAAMRLCIDRLMGKHRPCAVALPSPEAPDYTVTALTEIHRALGAGEIASDEASRLVDFVGRTARVLASKAVAEIDVAERLARCEEALLLLLNAGGPTAAPEAMAEPAIDNNNAETMVPRCEDTGEPIAVALAEVGAAAGNNEATGADPVDHGEAAAAARERRKRRVNGIAIERLMGSTSPLAHLAGAMAEKMPPLPPQPPGAGIGTA